MDAVALIMGIALQFVATDAVGWTSYEVVTQNADSFPLDQVPVTLRREPLNELLLDGGRINSASRWIAIGTAEYVALSGGYQAEWEIDAMSSLANGTSPGGRIRFVDDNSDGRVGDGDLLQVRLDANPAEFQTYFLQIGAGMGGSPPSITSGVKSILQTPDGPLHVISDTPWVQLTHAGDVVTTTVLSRLDVGQTFGGLLSTDDVEFRFAIDGEPLQSGPVRDAPVILPDGVSVDFWEETPNGLVDTGDRFFVDGLPRNVSVRFELARSAGGMARIGWLPGYGHIAGQIPSVELWIGWPPGANTTFGALISHWHPEFEFGKTLAISVVEDSTVVLDHVPLSPGILGAWPGGSLSFADSDSDGVWSSEDPFTLQGNPGARYRIDVSLLFDTRTFQLDLGS